MGIGAGGGAPGAPVPAGANRGKGAGKGSGGTAMNQAAMQDQYQKMLQGAQQGRVAGSDRMNQLKAMMQFGGVKPGMMPGEVGPGEFGSVTPTASAADTDIASGIASLAGANRMGGWGGTAPTPAGAGAAIPPAPATGGEVTPTPGAPAAPPNADYRQQWMDNRNRMAQDRQAFMDRGMGGAGMNRGMGMMGRGIGGLGGKGRGKGMGGAPMAQGGLVGYADGGSVRTFGTPTVLSGRPAVAAAPVQGNVAPSQKVSWSLPVRAAPSQGMFSGVSPAAYKPMVAKPIQKFTPAAPAPKPAAAATPQKVNAADQLARKMGKSAFGGKQTNQWVPGFRAESRGGHD